MRTCKIPAFLCTILLMMSLEAFAANKKTLYSFPLQGNQGAEPAGTLIFDSAGNAYGVTTLGGNFASSCESSGCGTVYELVPQNGKWKHVVLYRFRGTPDGSNPASGLVMDSAGSLYGTTQFGGSQSCASRTCGTVFRLSPGSNGKWKETILHAFTARGDGAIPTGEPTFGPNGHIYGTTIGGGLSNFGVVFEVSQGSGGHWKESIIHSFDENSGDGGAPTGPLIFDASGDIYGATVQGGAYGGGVVYELKPSGTNWKEEVLHNFTGGKDGASLYGGVVFHNDHLFGFATGGGAFGIGTAFKMTPLKGNWPLLVIHTFNGANKGGSPGQSTPIFDANGNIYGTTFHGGTHGDGIVYELIKNQNDVWHETVLYNFPGGEGGANPCCGVVQQNGSLFGVANGVNNAGVVFEIMR